MDWHKREENAQWWEYFRVLELPEEDLMDEGAVVTGLRHVKRLGFKKGKIGKPTKSVIDRYSYPRQEIEVGRSDKLKTRDDESTFGKVVAHDRLAQTLDIEKGPSRADDHPETAFAADVIGTVGVQRSVMRLAERMIEAARLEGVPYECGVELLQADAVGERDVQVRGACLTGRTGSRLDCASPLQRLNSAAVIGQHFVVVAEPRADGGVQFVETSVDAVEAAAPCLGSRLHPLVELLHPNLEALGEPLLVFLCLLRELPRVAVCLLQNGIGPGLDDLRQVVP